MKKKLFIGFVLFLATFALFGETKSIDDISVATKESLEKVLNSVVPVKKGFDGSAGTGGEYVLFGVWPQDKKADNVKIDTSKTEVINGWFCYKGSDECYYVKEEAKPYDDYKFNDGSAIESGEKYYFLLKPILWRVVDKNYQGGKLLVAENILDSGCFCTSTKDRDVNGKSVSANNYENSTVRAWLNGLNGTAYEVDNFTNVGFINKAFSNSSIEKIRTVNVDNSAKSTGYDGSDLKKVEKYVCNNTKDKVFLLSENEVTKESYGFSDYEDSDNARRRKTTDYARATVAYSSKDSKYMDNGWWWLRSPTSRYSNFARGVKYDGDADSSYSIAAERIAGGFVPALSISF